eukprot:CAMPEP_0194027596 /NCGR_PEP_ID=MMETSP0009_2-20130614/1732_1 /TAXON_ID=210454 /ORGANISM="Grammatophora oceanica, Strain CCMP 410" /LENGTH=34 /DNA_ID= /DNA_START= /DNA_END= /DNA_ORIENTATION=
MTVLGVPNFSIATSPNVASNDGGISMSLDDRIKS